LVCVALLWVLTFHVKLGYLFHYCSRTFQKQQNLTSSNVYSDFTIVWMGRIFWFHK